MRSPCGFSADWQQGRPLISVVPRASIEIERFIPGNGPAFQITSWYSDYVKREGSCFAPELVGDRLLLLLYSSPLRATPPAATTPVYVRGDEQGEIVRTTRNRGSSPGADTCAIARLNCMIIDGDENMDQETGKRTLEHRADQIFVDRWSPRGFNQDQITEGVLNTFFEAARWAPSAFNSQPWRFLYALRGQSEFETFLCPLIPFNQSWARHAAALLYLLSRTNFTPSGKAEQQFSRTHSFDCGAAWANFANQATLAGWAAHAMSGFDIEGARTVLKVPEGFSVEIAIALGRKGEGAYLPPGLLQRERPSGRSRVRDFVGCGSFPERFRS